ncbi:myosin light chain alkali-like [Homalodisca vitripennis]|nr:myosin light chain alkali-like [Homalodisca vitripennis]
MSRRFGTSRAPPPAPPAVSSPFESKHEEPEKKKKEEYVVGDNELKGINAVFNIYDACGAGTIDCCQVPDALRALGLNPTIGLVEKIAGAIKPGEKQFTVEEFVPIYGKCKIDKDNGVYEDFIECLKLYDKAENGYMPLAELTYALSSLGEKLSEEELDTVLNDCMDPEDDEGNIPYIPFLARMCEKPVPKDVKPL